jgi:acyl-CoA synthetase (AMP-forming)/AMP-acid ligase II
MALNSAHLCADVPRWADVAGSRTAVLCGGRSLSWRELAAGIASLSLWLSEESSIRSGDVVALLALNSDAAFEALLATLDAGAVVAPLNWRWSAAELAASLDEVNPTLLLIDEACAGLAASGLAVAACSPRVLCLGPAPIAWLQLQLQRSASADGAAGQNNEPMLDSSSMLQGILQRATAVAAGTPKERRAAAAAPQLLQQQQQQQQVVLHAPLSSGNAATALVLPGSSSALCDGSVTAAAAVAAAGPHQVSRLRLRQPNGGACGAAGAAMLVFTSGTSGAPKSALLSHAALRHSALAKLACVGYCADDVYLHAAPLCHVGGLSSAFALLAAGGTHVFLPRYSPAAAAAAIQSHGVTTAALVPAMLADLAELAAADGGISSSSSSSNHSSSSSSSRRNSRSSASFPTLRMLLLGGGALGPEAAAAASALAPGAAVWTAYGMTEASSSLTFISLGEQMTRRAAVLSGAPHAGGVPVGWSAPGMQLRIAPLPQHTQQGNQWQQQQQQQQQQEQQQRGAVVGEVLARGPQLMTGYYRSSSAGGRERQSLQPDRTPGPVRGIGADGWLRTGDLGAIDDHGCLWLMGRVTDSIKSGGENVSQPWECRS